MAVDSILGEGEYQVCFSKIFFYVDRDVSMDESKLYHSLLLRNFAS